MELTLSFNLLEAEFFYVSPKKPVSTVPLVYLTFAFDEGQVAYNLNNQAKLTRKMERIVKTILKKWQQENAVYQQALDQDLILMPDEHLDYQAALVKNLLILLKDNELPVIRLELVGSWPVFQTKDGQLDLTN